MNVSFKTKIGSLKIKRTKNYNGMKFYHCLDKVTGTNYIISEMLFKKLLNKENK